MNQSRVIDYNLTITEFVLDVNDWLKDRIPYDARDVKEGQKAKYIGGKNIARDSTDMDDIVDTMQMWEKVIADPYTYSQQDKLYSYVCNHTRGFVVRRGINNYDNSMSFAVIDVLSAIDYFYRVGGDYQKQELANAIKKYKLLRAENMFAKFKISVSKPQKLLSTKQR